VKGNVGHEIFYDLKNQLKVEIGYFGESQNQDKSI